MTRRMLGPIGLVGLLAIAALPASAPAAARPHLTKIKSPRANQVVGVRGTVQAVVRSREPLGALTISANRRNVTRLFRGSGGVYRATLRRRDGLHPGVNSLFVKTRRYKDFDHVSFVVARRAPKLLSVTDLDVGGRAAPVRVKVRTGRNATLRAWLNGGRVEDAFHPQGWGYVGRFGANDGVRQGRNRLTVLVYSTRRGGRAAVHDFASKTFRVRGLIAGAGDDRVADAGEFIELQGSATGARGGRDYHWAIVDAPDGARYDAVLKHADTATPEFRAKEPGTYRVRATVRVANDASAAAHAASDVTSSDTVTVSVRADMPPIGWRLTMGAYANGTLSVNNTQVPGTGRCTDAGDPLCQSPFITYAVFDRQTFDRKASGVVYLSRDTPKDLADLADSFKKAPGYLMMVTASASRGGDPNWIRLLDTLGVADTSAARDAGNGGPVTIVGVPGAPRGSAFAAAPICRGAACNGVPLFTARMLGYVRLNPLAGTDGLFEFVRNDQVEFNTDVPAPAGQIKMKAGTQTFTANVPTDGSSGFFLVTVDSRTLAPLSQDVFVTNNRFREEDVPVQQRLATALNAATEGDNGRGGVLVLLQAFGRPNGVNLAWQDAADAVQKLGGTAQVFVKLNLYDSDEPDEGRYALVGRAAMGAPGAESSKPLTGRDTDGVVHGMLARARDDQYMPLLSGPVGSINFDLVNIVNRPTAPGGGFPKFDDKQAAAATVLGRDKDVMGVCPGYDPVCDVRKTYYEKNRNWSSIQDALGGRSATRACHDNEGKTDPKFTEKECLDVADQLYLEVSRRNRVQAYFDGLQAPFKGADASAVVDITAISDEIQKDIKPPDADTATTHALTMVSFLVKIVGAGAGVVNPAAGTAANGIAAAFGLAAYLTNDKGTPDLVGPQVKSRASQLGVELSTRYKDAAAYFATEGQIVMSDWTKTTDVVSRIANDQTWELGDPDKTRARLERATRQSVYQTLVPVAYPVLYDLGFNIRHATDWICRSRASILGALLYDKRLFQKTGTGAEVPWLVRDQGTLFSHLMAVGAVRTVGSKHDAYVPAPPADLTSKLFRDPDDPTPGGLGFNKLQFYSPANFRVFSPVLQQETRSDGLGNKKYGYWDCQSMPNPPGNSSDGSGF